MAYRKPLVLNTGLKQQIQDADTLDLRAAGIEALSATITTLGATSATITTLGATTANLTTANITTDNITTANITNLNFLTKNGILYAEAGVVDTYSTLPQDCGPLSEPSFTDNGDGTATIGSFDAFVYPSTDYTGILKKYTIAGVTLTFTADTEEYVVVDYNGGVPICRKETNKYLINGSSIFTVFICWRQDSTIHSITNAPFGYGLANKVHRYIYNTTSYKRSVDGGLIIAETTSPYARTITVTSSIVYAGITPIVVNPFDSSTHTFTRVNHVAGVWTYTHETYYDNSLYDNGTNAVAGTANRWVNRFFYRSIGDVREVFYTLGTIQHFNEDECHQELPPTPPLILRDHCIYIGFACIEVGATSGTMHPAFDFIEEVPDYVFYDSAGIFTSPSVSTGSGSITIGTGEYLLYNDGTYNSPTLNRYKITGGTFNPTAGITSYIVANYNSGTPIVEMITDVTPINQSEVVPVVTVFNDAGSIKYLLWDLMAQGLANKLSHRLVKTDRFRAEPNGFVITESTDRVVHISAGKIWYGAAFVALDAIKSDDGGQEMTLYYHSAGVWTSTTITQYNNSQYDNGTNLVSLKPNKYAVNWIYRVLNQGSLQTLVVLGTTNYGTLADASASVPPSNLPALFTNFSIFVGRIIVKTNAPTASKIDVATTMVFSGITMHNGLSGLQGGDIDTSSFYHSDQAINTTDAPSFTDVTISDLNRDFAEYGFDTKLATGIPYSERIKFKVTFTYSAPNIVATLSFNSPYTSFSYYINGKKFTVTATEIGAYTASATAAEGIWFFYIGHTTTDVATPAMTLSQVPWVIYDPDVLLFNARFNTTTNVVTWIGEERHTAGRDIFNHARNHAQGALYKEGFIFNTYNGLTNLSGNTDDNFGRAQVQLTNGKFFDEDIQITIQHADAAIASTTASPYYDWNLTIQQFLGFTTAAIAGTDTTTIVFSETHTLVTGQAITVMQGNTTTIRGTTTIQTGGTGTSFTVTPSVTGMTTGDVIVVGARIPIFYIDSAVGGVYTWRRLTTTSFLGVSGGVAVDSSTIASMTAQYNNPAGGWSNMTANRYYCVYICATNLTSQPVVAIFGQSQSTGSNLTTTLAEPGWSFNNLAGLQYLSVQEMVPIYRLTFLYNTTGLFTNTHIKLVNATFINVRVATATGTIIGVPGPVPTASTVPVDTTNFNNNLSAADDTVQKALDTIDDLTLAATAADISTDTTNFDHNLSAADDTVQKALDTLDDLIAGGGAGTTFTVSQTGHGFTVLTPIYFDAGIWKAAQANDMLTLATHVITEITSLDAFVAAQSGRFTVTAHGLTIETFYFVSTASAGALVATQPATGFSNPVLFVEDANTVHILPYRASELATTVTDINAIHSNEASEIHVLTAKTTPVDLDEFVIEDSEDGWNKKRITRASVFLSPIVNGLTVQTLTVGLGAGSISTNTALGANVLNANTTGALNTAIGYQALYSNTYGTNNTAVGFKALYNNTTGVDNIAIGVSALDANTFGNYNIGIGVEALASNTTGNHNIAIGVNTLNAYTGGNSIAIGSGALQATTTGVDNIAIGVSALDANTFGNYNIGIGVEALTSNTTGNNNIAIGESALSVNVTGRYNVAIGNFSLQNNLNDYNVAIGYNALKANTTGNFNTAVGYETLKVNTTGGNNVAIGYQSLTANLTGRGNVAVGIYSLTSNTFGDYNIAVGPSALVANTTGQYNIAIGCQALQQNTIGIQNVAVGVNALVYNSTGVNNVAIGFRALDANTFGNYNIGIGTDALGANTTGTNNIAIGYLTLDANTTGTNNVAIGGNSLGTNTTGTDNVAIGTEVLSLNTTGINNVALGNNALFNNTFGNYNIAVGHNALNANTTGISNTAIGYNAGSKVTYGSNLTLVGYNAAPSAITATNEITLGDGNVTVLRCNTQTIVALSDARDKADINDFDLGLNFINAVKVRKFHWDRREWYPDGVVDGSKKSGMWDVGVIAQEIKQVQKDFDADYLNMVLESNPDRLEVANGKLLLPLVKAVQELSKQVEDLKTEIEILKKK